jgi:hypothetical protein
MKFERFLILPEDRMKQKPQSELIFLLHKRLCPMPERIDPIGLVLKLGQKNVGDVLYHWQWMRRQPGESMPLEKQD